MRPAGRSNTAVHVGTEAQFATTFSNDNMGSTAAFQPTEIPPVVPVAAAPKNDNLYDDMLRYHNENDSSSDEETTRRRRRRAARGGVGHRSSSDDEDFDTGKWCTDNTDNESSTSDRKLPAIPRSQLKSPPLDAPMTAPGTGGPGESPAPSKPERVHGSFYEAALAESRMHTGGLMMPESPKPAKKPGAVQVNEPGMNPNSAMYRAAYGGLGTRSSNGSPMELTTFTRGVAREVTAPQENKAWRHTLDSNDDMEGTRTTAMHAKLFPKTAAAPNSKHKASLGSHSLGLSQIQHLGGVSGNPHSSKPNRYSSTDFSPPTRLVVPPVAPPGGLSNGPQVGAPEHMMNIGNDQHIGYGSSSTDKGSRNKSREKSSNQRNASPKRKPILSGMRKRFSDFPMRHAAEAAAVSNESRDGVSPGYPFATPVHSAEPTQAALRTKMPGWISGGSTGISKARSSDDFLGGLMNNNRQSVKRKPTMAQVPPSPSIPTAVATPAPMATAVATPVVGSVLQDEQMDEDLRLALEISKRDTRRQMAPSFHNQPPLIRNRPITGTNIYNSNHHTSSDLARPSMAHEDRSSHSSLADVMLALKLSAEESDMANPQRSTNLDELLALEMAQETHQNMTDFVAAGISSEPSDQDEQMRILEKIRQEQEQKELELAIQASQAWGPKVPQQKSSDFLTSQRQAMNEYTRHNAEAYGQAPAAASTRPVSQRQGSHRSYDSAGRRQELLERGTSETKLAIQSGKAQIVVCRGCGGRLQAPASYSLVFCPKCQTISPA